MGCFRNTSGAIRVLLSALLLVFTFSAPQLHAQAVGATLTGTVTDQSGGVVSNAEISIKNNATGDVRPVTSNADGIYSAPNLQPGVYTVTITASGFSTTVQNNVTLTVGASQLLNFTMQVGQSTQTVQVTTEAPTVDLTNAEIGNLTTEKTIVDLPLNGRSWSDLANLQAGVYQLHTQPDIQSRDRFTRGYGVQLSISGARPQQNNYRVDGISINDPGNGGPGNVLGSNAGVDAISEFSVLTTNYSTEYGRASGGVINATTKSGTNSFHGSAYDFLRNSALDARNVFDPPQIPEFRRNQFGASAGGPIIKGKTFIFGDYEGLREAKGLSNASIIPSPSAAASAVAAIQPYLAAFFPINGSLNGKNVCNGPTQTTADPLTNLCVFGANQISSENYYIIRVDHTLTANDQLSGTFFRDKSTVGTPDEYDNKIVNTGTSSTFATIAETHTFSSSIVNSARFGFHRDFQGGPLGATVLNPAISDPSFGAIPGFDAPQVFIGGNALFTGGLTSPNPQVNHWNTYQVYDDAFWTKGKHSLRFGFSAERDQLNVNRSPRPGGLFTFKNMSDFLNDCGGSPAAGCSGNSGTMKLTTDLPGSITPRETRASVFGVYIQDDWRIRPNLTINLGVRYEPMSIPSDAQGKIATLASLSSGTILCGQSNNPLCTPFPNGHLFSNNTLRDIDPRVGFAWDPKGDGKMSVRGGFGLYDQLPLIAFMGSTAAQTYPFLASGSSGNLSSGSFGEFSSFGACHTPPAPGDAAFCQVGGAQRVAFIDQNPKRAYVMQWNLNIQREIVPNLTVMLGYVGSHGVHGTTQTDDTNIVLPTVGNGLYIWPCLGSAQSPATVTNINDCQGIGSGTQLNSNNGVGRLPATFFRNSSVYHGLELQVTKKLSQGFQVTGSFTYQKSIDTASGAVISDSVITAISSLNWFDPKLTRGVSDFNNSKVLSINGLWNIPTPKSWTGFAEKASGGWQMGGIFSASSGEPFTALLAGDPLGLNNTDSFAYPNRLTGPGCKTLTNPGNFNNYVKLQCFQIPAPTIVNGTPFIPLGNAGRNIMEGPGLENLDFSLVKNTRITKISEAFNVQFRFEVFNILNRGNFNPPVSNEFLYDPSTLLLGAVANPGPSVACTGNDNNSGCLAGAGGLSASDHTATTSRQLQLSLKLIW